MVKLGLISPIVTRVPGAHGAWESGAGIRELAEIAQHAEHLGYHHMTCSEHVAVPTPVAAVRGGTYWDPLATLGYLAAVTESLRLVTQVVVLGYHHPTAIAKRYGTLDRVSGGRLVLGLGVGSLQEEFELLDAPFHDRGARADDAMRALRIALREREPDYQGSHYAFSGFLLDPGPVQAHVPFWVGGRTARSLRRALDLGDGWVPFGLSPPDMAGLLADADLPAHFDVVLPAGTGLDPAGSPRSTCQRLADLEGAGATIVNCSISAESLPEYLDQLTALAELAAVRPDTDTDQEM